LEVNYVDVRFKLRFEAYAFMDAVLFYENSTSLVPLAHAEDTNGRTGTVQVPAAGPIS
jgi:hypothetical protein